MTVITDPLVNARTELTVTQDDLRAAQRALERERTRLDGVRDRLRREAARQAAAVSYIASTHGAGAANTVRDILAGTHSHQPPTEAFTDVDDEADLRTARQLAASINRDAADTSSATELTQLLVAQHHAAADRSHESLRQLTELTASRRHAVQELAVLQATLTAAADDALTRLRDDYAASIELIRAELEDHSELSARERRILGIIHDIGSGENADRSRRELAQAEVAVARLRREHPADVR
jgi:hypothetical protein